MNGLYLIKPTSIASTGAGSTATISANGSVTFSAVTSLELRGIFSADYDNYTIVCRNTSTVSGSTCLTQLLSGTTPATGASDYTYQYLYVASTSVSGARTTSSTWVTLAFGSGYGGEVLTIYGPYLAQPTALRIVNARDNLGTEMFDVAQTHNQSTSYDGLKFTPGASAALTGRIAVYGMRK